MDERTEELVAIGASVAANCYPCMKHHLAKCDELGVARAEVRAAAEVGKMVNRGAASNTRKFVDELLGGGVRIGLEQALGPEQMPSGSTGLPA